MITAGGGAFPASADSGTEGQFISDTNSARADHGLRPYAVESDLTSVARRWAEHMARNNSLEHNPSYSSQVCCWSSIGENVGEGSSESSIQQAFMSSAPHRDNILSSSFTQVGIGTARSSDGTLYVDEVFRRPTHSAAAPAPARPVSHPVTHSVPVRASRSVARAPRVVRRPAAPRHVAAAVNPARALALRWLAAQRTAPPAATDPVAGALAFPEFMRALCGTG